MPKKYGIPFMGSKNFIAEELIDVLPAGKRFVDLFGGGFAMSHCAVESGKFEAVLYQDANPLLPPLLKKAIAGEYNYNVFRPEFITRERFFAEKEKDGYVKWIWSFGNNGKDYLFGRDKEKQKESIHNFIVFNVLDDTMKTLFPACEDFVTAEDITERRAEWRAYCRAKNRIMKSAAICSSCSGWSSRSSWSGWSS